MEASNSATWTWREKTESRHSFLHSFDSCFDSCSRRSTAESTDHLFFSTQGHLFYACCCGGSCSWHNNRHQCCSWHSKTDTKVLPHWLSKPSHPCNCAAAASTGNFAGSVITPPAIPHPCKWAAVAILCMQVLSHPLLITPLHYQPPCKYVAVLSHPRVYHFPSWALRPARCHNI